MSEQIVVDDHVLQRGQALVQVARLVDELAGHVLVQKALHGGKPLIEGVLAGALELFQILRDGGQVCVALVLQRLDVLVDGGRVAVIGCPGHLLELGVAGVGLGHKFSIEGIELVIEGLGVDAVDELGDVAADCAVGAGVADGALGDDGLVGADRHIRQAQLVVVAADGLDELRSLGRCRCRAGLHDDLAEALQVVAAQHDAVDAAVARGSCGQLEGGRGGIVGEGAVDQAEARADRNAQAGVTCHDFEAVGRLGQHAIGQQFGKEQAEQFRRLCSVKNRHTLGVHAGDLRVKIAVSHGHVKIPPFG